MKHSKIKKLRPYWIGAGALAIVVGVSIYMQWHTTQQLYFTQDTVQEKEPISPTTEVTENPVVTPVEQEEPTVSVSPQVVVSSEPENIQPKLAEDILPEILPDQVPERIPTAPPTAEADQLVAEATAMLYQYQSQFVGSLQSLYSQASSRFHSLPQEQQSPEMRDDIAMEYALVGSQLEADCDGLVLAVLNQLTNDLNRIGASVEPVVSMKAAYIQAKEAKKAEYQGMISQ